MQEIVDTIELQPDCVHPLELGRLEPMSIGRVRPEPLLLLGKAVDSIEEIQVGHGIPMMPLHDPSPSTGRGLSGRELARIELLARVRVCTPRDTQACG